MTKALAATYRAALLDNGVDLITGNVKIAAMSSGYTYSAAHDFHSDLSSIIATTGNLASKTATDGYFDAANPNLGSPAGPSVITQLWVFLDTGTSATSPLVYYFDEDVAGNPLSITCNGELITLNLDTLGLFRV